MNMKSITTATINFIIISLQINVLKVSVNFFIQNVRTCRPKQYSWTCTFFVCFFIMCIHATLSNIHGLVRFLFFCFHNVYTCHPKQYSWTSTFFIMRTHATVYIFHPELNMPVSFSCRRWVQSQMSSIHHDSLTPCWPYRQWGQTKHTPSNFKSVWLPVIICWKRSRQEKKFSN